MTLATLVLIGVPALLFAYAYVGYPVLLWLASRSKPPRAPARDPELWPGITIIVPAHNAEASIHRTLDHLLATDYPADRRQIIVVSDASSDHTDEIVRDEYGPLGVELHRLPHRGGKTAAENFVARFIRHDIVVNTDATIVVPPGSIKLLVRGFQDPTVGVVSGRDVSVASGSGHATKGEADYSNYEGWVRSLESRMGWIVGATGSLYAMRRELFDPGLPDHVSRDFATSLMAYERGLHSISADGAECIVGQAPSLRAEFRRKARTMVLGLDTVWHFRRLLDPMRHGRFAMMLWSHKIARWLVYLVAPIALAGLAILAAGSTLADWTLQVAAVAALLGWLGVLWPAPRRVPALLAICFYAMAIGAAAFVAWLRFFRGQHSVVWEPTRRAR